MNFRPGAESASRRIRAVGRRWTHCRPTHSARIFTRRDSIPASPEVSRIRRPSRRAPPRSPPPAARGSALPTGRSRSRDRRRAVPERLPGTPRTIRADHRVGPASTSSQRDRPGSTLPRSNVGVRQRWSSPRQARRPGARTAGPTRGGGRGLVRPMDWPRRDLPSSPPSATQPPGRQPCPTPGTDMGASAPCQSMQHCLP